MKEVKTKVPKVKVSAPTKAEKEAARLALVAELQTRRMSIYDMNIFLESTYGPKVADTTTNDVIHTPYAEKFGLQGQTYFTTALGKSFNKAYFWIGEVPTEPFTAEELATMKAARDHKYRRVIPMEPKEPVVTEGPPPVFGTREWRILHGLKVKPLAPKKA